MKTTNGSASSPQENFFDVAVIGAGPAGMMAAGVAAELGESVILLEKNKELGKKLLLTGNGRCNITNAEFNLRKLVANYGKGGDFLFHAFSIFGPKEVINFFNKLGIKTKIEAGNRVFPLSGNAGDVLCALNRYLLENKVNISLNTQISKVIIKGKKIEKLLIGGNPSAGSGQVIAKKYIFCTGGKSYPVTGSTGDGYKWIKDMGHSITEPSPALVPIKVKEDWVKDLQGLSLQEVKITVAQNNKKQFQEVGDILFTHFGLSGPVVLNMSKRVGELLKKGEVIICIDFYPNLNTADLIRKINEGIIKNPKISVKNFLINLMPQRLVPVFMQSVKIDGDKPTNSITKNERVVIAKQLKQIGVTAIELLGFESAHVTSGGVALKEIDGKTMKSKIIDNLYFAGEIIDIDGRTGGFNLQACWSTGYLAGKNAGN